MQSAWTAQQPAMKRQARVTVIPFNIVKIGNGTSLDELNENIVKMAQSAGMMCR